MPAPGEEQERLIDEAMADPIMVDVLAMTDEQVSLHLARHGISPEDLRRRFDCLWYDLQGPSREDLRRWADDGGAPWKG